MIKTTKYTKRKNYPEPAGAFSTPVRVKGQGTCTIKIDPLDVKALRKVHNELKKKCALPKRKLRTTDGFLVETGGVIPVPPRPVKLTPAQRKAMKKENAKQ